MPVGNGVPGSQALMDASASTTQRRVLTAAWLTNAERRKLTSLTVPQIDAPGTHLMDILINIPPHRWADWLAEGDLAGAVWSGREHMLEILMQPTIEPGERVYIMQGGIVRGWAPLLRMERTYSMGRWMTQIIRGGGAQAVTAMCLWPDLCLCPILWRGPHPKILTVRVMAYRSWDRIDEWRFPDWQTYDWTQSVPRRKR